MIVPPLYRFLRPWLFLAIMVLIWTAGLLLLPILVLIRLPRDSESEPLSREDVDV